MKAVPWIVAAVVVGAVVLALLAPDPTPQVSRQTCQAIQWRGSSCAWLARHPGR